MKKILWFSRHEMTTEQLGALERKFPDGISLINMSCLTYGDVRNLDTCISDSDIIAINDKAFEESFLRLSQGKPVIRPVYEKVSERTNLVVNHFIRWEQIIDIIVKDF